jgi:hypothetical protein
VFTIRHKVTTVLCCQFLFLSFVHIEQNNLEDSFINIYLSG